MKKIFTVVIIALTTSCIGQNVVFTDLDKALKQPDNVRCIKLKEDSKYKKATEFPLQLSECKNLQSIFIESHNNLDIAKLLKLLSYLPKLDTLQLNYCSLKKIPDEIGLFTNLKYLGFKGNNIEEISDKINELKSLEYLDISWNFFHSIPFTIRTLPRLTCLNLETNRLDSLPDGIGVLSQLTHLYLNNNIIEALPSAICNLNNLQELILTENRLTTLPDDIHKLKSLKKLDLSINPLLSLPKSIGQTNLEEIYIKVVGNGFRETSYPNELFQISTLKHITLTYINIGSFPSSISKMKNLSSIDLDFGLYAFNWVDGLNKLSLLPNLEKAKLFISLTDKKEILELKNIKKLTNIKELKIGVYPLYHAFRNKQIIQDSIHYKFMQYVYDMNGLTKLTFYYEDEILPPEIGKLKELRYLELKASLNSLPAEIGMLINLEEFILSGSKKYSLSIPKEIGNMTNLKKISFYESYVNNLPDEISNLSNLEELSIRYGNLTSLPPTIVKLQKLQKIDLRSNDFQVFPSEIYHLHALKYLDLSANNIKIFNDTIPTISNLEELDLFFNKNLKMLPQDIGLLKQLKHLNLSHTQVSTLPMSLINHQKIEKITLCDSDFVNKNEINRLFKGKIVWKDCIF